MHSRIYKLESRSAQILVWRTPERNIRELRKSYILPPVDFSLSVRSHPSAENDHLQHSVRVV